MKRAIFAIISLGLLHGFVGLRIAARWPAAQAHPVTFWGAVVLFFLLGLIAPFFEVFAGNPAEPKPTPAARWLDRLSYLALGVFSCLLIYTLAADVVTMLWEWISPPANEALFDHDTLLTLAALTLLTVGLGVFQAATGPAVREVEVPLKNLPPAFDGFKIVQVSDLHIGPTIGRRYAEKTVRIANRLGGDLIALTGDFIDGEVETLKHDIEPLKELTAPHGAYFVTGNHEYYWDAEGWCAHFEGMGVTVLENAHRVIRQGEDAIVLAGVTDYSIARRNRPDASSPHKAAEGAPEGLVKVLLAHQPASYAEAQPAGFDLQLSGHTHAGQYFPYSLVIRFFQKYYKGLNRHGDLWVYVNRGTGYWGPPLRTLVQGEITLIRLRRDEG
ncbi:MAG: metallophosphoesterase [Alphaproteobacteria bacterium]|nr:metallophosphoesterase [Alphaproteobacteria bacterium]